MKVVIPGGSGQVGTILARALHGDGHDVVILAREPQARPWRVVGWDGATLGSWSTGGGRQRRRDQSGRAKRELPIYPGPPARDSRLPRDIDSRRGRGDRSGAAAASNLAPGQHGDHHMPTGTTQRMTRLRASSGEKNPARPIPGSSASMWLEPGSAPSRTRWSRTRARSRFEPR